MSAEKRKRLLQSLAELDEQVEDLPDEQEEEEEEEEEEPPKKRLAQVANSTGKKLKNRGEIEGASEATMQAALTEIRKVKDVLQGKNPDKKKAQSILDGVFSMFGID